MNEIVFVDVSGHVLVDVSGNVLVIPGTPPQPTPVKIPGIEWQALERLGWGPYGIP